MKTGLIGLLMLFSLLCASCSQQKRVRDGLSYSEVLSLLEDSLWFADLDQPGSGIVTSYDRTGKNHDYNWFVRREKGWVVLADLKGPGVLTKFWFTGTKDDQQFRFYLDGARKPAVNLSLKEMRSGHPWFPAGPANYEHGCWCSYVPVPYAKRLVVMTEDKGYKNDGSRPKIFYQINYTPLKQPVQSMPVSLSEQDERALEAFVVDWDKTAVESYESSYSARLDEQQGAEVLAGESKSNILKLTGPAIIRKLELEPDFESIPSALQKESLLRDVILRIYWDDAKEPSVEVPLGDFFGSFWKRTRFQSRFFGMQGSVFNSQFPMPFTRSARIELENKSSMSLPVRIKAMLEPVDKQDDSLGYFHAVWTRSEPARRPHQILNAKGKGKYVGCILSATSLDKSWWLLESDESMIRDGESEPCWHGTGLEDYFNASWYYKNVFVRPLHGLLFKAPFRTVQYRIHRPDSVAFERALDVKIERGPDQASRGIMESVSFYYMQSPTAAVSDILQDRSVPKDPVAQATLMGELANFERLGDYQAAYDAIDSHIAQYPVPEQEPFLRLRQIALIERMKGIDDARPLYDKFIAETKSDAAKKQAELLLWFHANKEHALLSVYCKSRTSVYIDGRKYAEGGNPQHMFVLPLQLRSGKHAMTFESVKGQYPDWVHGCIRTHNGPIYTDLDWRFSFKNESQSGDWRNPGFDASSWYVVHNSYVEGPPASPYIWMDPHPFVDMHSKPVGVWISQPWPEGKTRAVFRKEFVLP